MDTATLLVVITASLLTIICIGWFLLSRKHPENAATHDDTASMTASGKLDHGVGRPAGPDADV